MAYNSDGRLVVGVSTRALFDLEKENNIFEREGLESYRKYQLEHEKDVLRPGPAFVLVRELLRINSLPGGKDRVEVIIMSRNNADTILRIFHSIDYYGLAISRAVLSGGAVLTPYLKAFGTDLFLSACGEDVQSAVDAGIAAGIVCTGGRQPEADRTSGYAVREPLRIAFDGDAVLFADESERLFQEKGLAAFEENERANADKPMQEGPFAGFLHSVAALQREFPAGQAPIRTALVTSRCAPAHERVIRTLRAWDVRIDEVFFMGGLSKKEVLEAFGAGIFFDDQPVHTESASQAVPSARVPGRKRMQTGRTYQRGIYQKRDITGKA